MVPIPVEEFQERARAWLADNAVHAPRDYGAICPPELVEPARAWQKRLFDAGFAGIHWPVEYGGQGLGIEYHAVWTLECARAGVPAVLNMVGLVLAGGALLAFGSPEQRERLLRPTLEADIVWCQLFSEPGAGSDLASLSTRADRIADGPEGTRFVVNGQKVWCSGGRISEWGILMARTDVDAPRHQGISFFVCPMDLPGIEVRPLRQMTGESEFDEVFFTDVELSEEHLLGPLHGGWGVGMAVLTNERGHIGTAVIGLERRLEQMNALADGRDLSLIERQRLTALIARGTAARSLAQRQGPVASTAASLLKLGITEMMFDTAMLRGDLGGADAMLEGSSAQQMLGAPGGRIAGGTSQVQRTIIGERLLGLPREPRSGG